MNPTQCKFYERCSCNVCPLDKDSAEKEISPIDKTQYCLAIKRMAEGNLERDYLTKLKTMEE
jgi:hypothetical protein